MEVFVTPDTMKFTYLPNSPRNATTLNHLLFFIAIAKKRDEKIMKIWSILHVLHTEKLAWRDLTFTLTLEVGSIVDMFSENPSGRIDRVGDWPLYPADRWRGDICCRFLKDRTMWIYLSKSLKSDISNHSIRTGDHIPIGHIALLASLNRERGSHSCGSYTVIPRFTGPRFTVSSDLPGLTPFPRNLSKIFLNFLKKFATMVIYNMFVCSGNWYVIPCIPAL